MNKIWRFLVLSACLCFLFSGLSQAQIPEPIQAKLIQAEQNQKEIFKQLDEIKAELAVIKVRVSTKLGKKQP